MEKFYRIAGIDICVSADASIMYETDGDLTAFAVPSSASPFRYHFQIVPTLPEAEGELVAQVPGVMEYRGEGGIMRYLGAVSESLEHADMCVWYRGGGAEVYLCEKTYHTLRAGIVLDAIGAERLIVRNHGVILHASYIDYRGVGILFTAPSGTGKSTQAALWRDYRGAEEINGDRAVIQYYDGQVKVCGLPYAGSSGICRNRTLPLAALVYLEQGESNSITKLSGFTAFRKIWEGCCLNTWDRDDVVLASETVERVIFQTPVLLLRCLPDESAVEALESVLAAERRFLPQFEKESEKESEK